MANEELIIRIGAEAKKFQEELDKVKKQTEDLEKQLSKIAKISGVAFAALTAEVFLSVKAFAESEKALKKLTLAVQNQGLASGDLVKKYQAQANALQDLTGIDNDLIMEGQAVIQSMIGQIEVTEELTKAALDLSERNGGDVVGSFQLVGKAINGHTRGLSLLGIEIDENLTKQERTKQILEKITQVYGGASEAANKGLGSIRGLASAFDDFQSKLGSRFAPTIANVIKLITEFFDKLSKNEILLDIIATVVEFGIAFTGIVTAIASAGIAFTSFSALLGAIGIVGSGPIGLAIVAVGVLAAGFVALFKAMGGGKGNLENVREEIKATQEEIQKNKEIASGAKSDVFAKAFGFGGPKATDTKALEDKLASLKTQEKALQDSENRQLAVKKQMAAQNAEIESSKNKRIDDANSAHLDVLKLQAENALKSNIEFAKKEEDIKKQLRDANNKEEIAALNTQLKELQAVRARNKIISKETLEGLSTGVGGIAQGAAGVASTITGIVGPIADKLLPGLGGLFSQLFNFLAQGPAKVKELIGQFFSAIPQLVTNIITAIPALVQGLLDAVPTLLTGLLDQIPVIIFSLIEQLPMLFETVVTFIPNLFQQLAMHIPVIVQTMISQLPLIVQSIIDKLPLIFMAAIQQLPTITEAVIKMLPSIFLATSLLLPGLMVQLVVEFVKNIPQMIAAFAQEFMKIPGQFAQAVVDAFKSLFSGIGDIFGFAQGGVVGAARGAVLSGGTPGFDSIPVLAQPGELIVPKMNFEEVINAVAGQRMQAAGAGGYGGQMGLIIGFNSQEAEKMLTARQVEARSLGVLQEA